MCAKSIQLGLPYSGGLSNSSHSKGPTPPMSIPCCALLCCAVLLTWFPQVIAVLDWELSTLGNAWADVAYMCLAHHLPPVLASLSLNHPLASGTD